jgi:hypothetical protein
MLLLLRLCPPSAPEEDAVEDADEDDISVVMA